MTDYEFRQPTVAELPAVQQLRHAVLDPARLVQTDTALHDADYDPETIHMGAFTESGEVVSTARLDLDAEMREGRIVKVATHPLHRQRGLGGVVVLAAEQLALDRGIRTFNLSSRLKTVSFYRNLGYVLASDVFTSLDGVPNRMMRKRIGDG
jgi:predicted GNAT family N-acyltransferase